MSEGECICEIENVINGEEGFVEFSIWIPDPLKEN